MSRRERAATLAAFSMAICACASTDPAERATEEISAAAIRAHVEFLADDLLEGRGTGSRGYDLAAHYMAAQFRSFGLEPGGPADSYFQTVPLRQAWVVREGSSIAVIREGRERALAPDVDYVLSADFARAESEVQAPLVFAGYGVTAPELGYSDYEGIDARGKIVVTLPGAPSRFEPNARAHYSAGVVKAAAAVQQGAVGFVSIWTPDMERRFPWAALTRFSRRGGMRWLGADGMPQDAPPELRGRAVLNLSAGRTLFVGAAQSLDAVLAAASEGRPGGFDLPGELRVRTRSRWTELSGSNIVARLPGSDTALRDEVVVYTAHVDHEGLGEPRGGDSIYNGAIDNAAGSAALIEVARAFSRLPDPPKRSLLFIGTAAEEEGLLGADYFAANPTVPREAIVANLNMDGNHMLFPTADIIALGGEHSTLGAAVEDAATRVGLSVSPDPMPEQNFFIRSDQYPFVKRGVPALFFIGGMTSADTAIDGGAAAQSWLTTVYHTPFDDVSQDLHFESGAAYARAAFLTGLIVANAPARPRWLPDDFFGRTFGQPSSP